jgi:hypothetical protein
MGFTSSDQGLSARRAQFAGPSGLKGLVHNKKTSAIATFAALGGFVYGYNQGKVVATRASHVQITDRNTQACSVRSWQ